MSEIVANSEKNSEVGYKKPPKEYCFKPGQSGNPSGRPKGTLKEYIAKKLIEMSPEEKEAFLRGIPKESQWKMAEGNPPQSHELSGKDGQPIEQLIIIRDTNGSESL